jgi:hypothetical protein
MCLMAEETSGNPYFVRADLLTRLDRLVRDMAGLRDLPGVSQVY